MSLSLVPQTVGMSRTGLSEQSNRIDIVWTGGSIDCATEVAAVQTVETSGAIKCVG